MASFSIFSALFPISGHVMWLFSEVADFSSLVMKCLIVHGHAGPEAGEEEDRVNSPSSTRQSS